MFDRFYRIDNSRSRETGGTGLGLSIVHKVCSLHDAKISVESKEGQGTTFTIRFTKLPNN
jgi:two-component system OmpR family sensor kinase